MSEQYAREVLKRNVAQICQTIGWNGINSSPLDIMIHVLEKYIQSLGTATSRYAEQFNRTEPNLNDLGLVFRDLNVQLPELAEFTQCVPSVPPPVSAERFPKPKESNLNFLKPGSNEVVTRPVHVHEHLPPMYPEKEHDTPVVAGTVEIRQNGVENIDNPNTVCTSPEVSMTDSPDKPKDPFKRPSDPISTPSSKRPRVRLEEEERTREISSVMMTMSGFLSPAREGKLPEARPPVIISEKHEKHKPNLHHSSAAKVPILEKADKKSKKSKILNGKIVKSKRKDKSHKGLSSKTKDNKSNKYPPGFLKPKDARNLHNHLPVNASKALTSPKPPMPPPALPVPENIRPVRPEQNEPTPVPAPKHTLHRKAIPVPRRIPISKSPLISSPVPVQKNHTVTSITMSDIEPKKEIVEEEVKLASQPDRSKINIFKRISNKSKEDKTASEVVPEKPPSTVTAIKTQDMIQESENVRTKPEESIVNNNDNNAVDLSKEMDLRAHEVISIDDDSLERNPALAFKNVNVERPNVSVKQSLQVPYPKDVVASVTPKIKKEKKHKDKKDKAAKLEAKLLKKQQQQLAFEMAQADKQSAKAAKPPKSSRVKNESKMPQMPPGFPYFPSRNLMQGPGLIPNSGLIPGSEFLTGLATNPALRGLPSTNLMSNPFAMTSGGPGLIPGSGFLPSNIGSGLPSPVPLMHMGNFPHSSRSTSVKIPPMLRRPSLEVIPVDNEDDRQKSMERDKDRHDKHKSPTIPNILQKHKSKYKDHKSNLLKMPPVQPDITIELNPPKMETVRQEPQKKPTPVRSPTPEPIVQPKVELSPVPAKPPSEVPTVGQEPENIQKKKDKSHKKEKKDKDTLKIKKKKDKKEKNKDKSDKKREKEERHELKEKIKKEKKEKKKEKSAAECLVPKLTLKLGSSNSNSPMPLSSPDVFKLNIKPVVKKEDDESSSVKEDPVSREHSPSPELAQISALVTRPPKLKTPKHNHVGEEEPQPSPKPSVSSPPRKNRPPSSHSNTKYKRILFKPLSKKGNFEDDMAISDEPMPSAPDSTEPTGPLPTPFYTDEQGNKIWVCPACGRRDNGSPMIGCDVCDGWYHWECVGITVEPGATEDWFCKSCKAKLAGKKRGRKPKVEKIRDCH